MTGKHSTPRPVTSGMAFKEVSLGDIFTDEQLRTAELCTTITEIRELVVVPNIAEINQRVGQENCPQFLAYMLGAALMSQGWPFQRAGQS